MILSQYGRVVCVFARQAASVDSYFTSCILPLQWDMFGPAFPDSFRTVS